MNSGRDVCVNVGDVGDRSAHSAARSNSGNISVASSMNGDCGVGAGGNGSEPDIDIGIGIGIGVGVGVDVGVQFNDTHGLVYLEVIVVTE